MSVNIKVRASSQSGYVKSLNGELMKIPEGWKLLKPGDAALSRRIKNDGPSWTIEGLLGKRMVSKGILAPAGRIEALRAELMTERAAPSYQKKLDAGRARRKKQETLYHVEFCVAVFAFLKFDKQYSDLAKTLAHTITEHAIPVGSGTVARTKMIPLEQRAEAATIAWLRHQTTAYDNMTIPRIKGKRREVRQLLAKKSRELLNNYRVGKSDHLPHCPLYKALHEKNS